MALAQTTKHCMEMKISKISKLESTWSSEFSIHGIPWKIQVRKMGQDADQCLGVYLYCANEDKSPNWPIWGAASFKLLPFSDDANPIENHAEPYVFDASGTGYGAGDLIKWNDLINQDKKYVKDDTINLEVKVTAEDPKDPYRSRMNFVCIDKCCNNSKFASFRLTVTNIVNMMAVKSPEFKLRGLTWNIQVSKMHSSHLGVSLDMEEDAGKEPIKISMTTKLVSSKKDVQSIEKCINEQHKYCTATDVEVVSWDEMMKPENGFVNDNSVTLEIEVVAENPKCGAQPNPKTEANSPQMECAICLEIIDSQELSVTPCGHLFCLACITKVVNNRAVCPTCNKAVQVDDLRLLYLPVVN